FGDLVKAQTGNSPQQLIQQHVIQQALHRLTSTTDSVSQIAYALGFEYPQYFSRLFKKQTGLTPQEYRAQA
ncbi:MAG: AraC family transcriptional regulator, partial [Prevotella sp.]|nr:AraC family transcriptional regulator [Prevotella sp.]